MALGFEGDKTSVYDKAKIGTSIEKYDRYWNQFEDLKRQNPSCATLYKPFAFVYVGPSYHLKKGMGASVDKYRNIIKKEVPLKAASAE